MVLPPPHQVIYMEVEPWPKQYGIQKWVAIGNVLGNTLITKKKTKKIPTSPPPKTQKKKPKPPWAFSLLAWIFYFQTSLPPFSTWTNTLIIIWGYLFISRVQFGSNLRVQLIKMWDLHVRRLNWHFILFFSFYFSQVFFLASCFVLHTQWMNISGWR